MQQQVLAVMLMYRQRECKAARGRWQTAAWWGGICIWHMVASQSCMQCKAAVLYRVVVWTCILKTQFTVRRSSCG